MTFGSWEAAVRSNSDKIWQNRAANRISSPCNGRQNRHCRPRRGLGRGSTPFPRLKAGGYSPQPVLLRFTLLISENGKRDDSGLVAQSERETQDAISRFHQLLARGPRVRGADREHR